MAKTKPDTIEETRPQSRQLLQACLQRITLLYSGPNATDEADADRLEAVHELGRKLLGPDVKFEVFG